METNVPSAHHRIPAGQGVVRAPDQGQLVVWPNGTRFFFQALAEDTGGVLSLATTAPPAPART